MKDLDIKELLTIINNKDKEIEKLKLENQKLTQKLIEIGNILNKREEQ